MVPSLANGWSHHWRRILADRGRGEVAHGAEVVPNGQESAHQRRSGNVGLLAGHDVGVGVEGEASGGSGPGVNGWGCRAQYRGERGEVVWVTGQDVVAETYGGDHQVGVDDV